MKKEELFKKIFANTHAMLFDHQTELVSKKFNEIIEKCRSTLEKIDSCSSPEEVVDEKNIDFFIAVETLTMLEIFFDDYMDGTGLKEAVEKRAREKVGRLRELLP